METTIYDELVAAARQKRTGSFIARIVARAYNAGWETGDVFEALNEGGLSVSFSTIEFFGQTGAI